MLYIPTTPVSRAKAEELLLGTSLSAALSFSLLLHSLCSCIPNYQTILPGFHFLNRFFFVTGMSYSTRHENMIRIEIMLLAQYQIMYFGHRGEPVVDQLLHPEIGHYICTGNVSIFE